MKRVRLHFLGNIRHRSVRRLRRLQLRLLQVVVIASVIVVAQQLKLDADMFRYRHRLAAALRVDAIARFMTVRTRLRRKRLRMIEHGARFPMAALMVGPRQNRLPQAMLRHSQTISLQEHNHRFQIHVLEAWRVDHHRGVHRKFGDALLAFAHKLGRADQHCLVEAAANILRVQRLLPKLVADRGQRTNLESLAQILQRQHVFGINARIIAIGKMEHTLKCRLQHVGKMNLIRDMRLFSRIQ
mmetsp:Transcript_27025/g.44347  ORF Transcript_27025/g.44347 Transcript_27025/m.44347 type:complete len:242 (-) Transcript_27025:365-1090(-)